VNGGVLVKPHVVPGSAPSRSRRRRASPVLDPALSPQLAGLMQHVLASPWYADKSQVPGYWVGGKTGTAQVWDNAHQRWLSNTYNFSCVGFIGRQQGHPTSSSRSGSRATPTATASGRSPAARSAWSCSAASPPTRDDARPPAGAQPAADTTRRAGR
jgi:membrane peptidoglycan carboxypeptidase